MPAKQPVTLLITNSIDYAADLLVQKLGSDRVFRYNTDLWRDYSLCFDGSGIEVSESDGAQRERCRYREGLPALIDARIGAFSADQAQ